MTQEFLNEKKLPFKECTREEQHILLGALLDGKLEYWPGHCSEFLQIRYLELNFIYRTKPIKRLVIPWEHIKPEYKWAAICSSGMLEIFSAKPQLCDEEYQPVDDYENGWSPLSALNIDTSGIDWRDSLVERPADK